MSNATCHRSLSIRTSHVLTDDANHAEVAGVAPWRSVRRCRVDCRAETPIATGGIVAAMHTAQRRSPQRKTKRGV